MCFLLRAWPRSWGVKVLQPSLSTPVSLVPASELTWIGMWSIRVCVSRYLALHPENGAMLTTGRRIEDVDKELGNKEGFAEGFDFRTPARGVATHVYASFEPSLKGRSFPLCLLCTLIMVS